MQPTSKEIQLDKTTSPAFNAFYLTSEWQGVKQQQIYGTGNGGHGLISMTITSRPHVAQMLLPVSMPSSSTAVS